jgi:hypothetical protein
MVKSHYLTGVLVVLSLVAGSAAASAAETGLKTLPTSSVHRTAYVGPGVAHRGPYRQFYGYRGLYDYAGPPAAYGFAPGYYGQWDSGIWSTGNGYY